MTATLTQAGLALELDAAPAMLNIIRERVSTWCRLEGVETTHTDRICLAIDEAAANIIRHAYSGAPGSLRLTGVSLKADDRHQLILTLEDDGKQVPLDTIRPRDLTCVRPGGLGVHLIREVMDEVCWTHRPAGGTTLKMTVDVTSSTTPDTKEPTHA
jgi:anti-sigma regulatory factor (Ser/Thr protein kinase)